MALRSQFQAHESIWDIGCDHGKLGLSFVEEKSVRSIHLVDPSLPVIQKLQHFIDAYITVGKFKVHPHFQKGQDVVLGPEKKLILIAGMGGKEILSIVSHLVGQMSELDDLVISPHRDLLQLREEFANSNLFLGSESLVFDEGRFYQVIRLTKRSGEKLHLFGKEIFNGPLGEKYREQQLSVFSAHQDVRSRNYVTYLRQLTQCF